MQLIYIIIDALIHHLYPAADKDLPLELLGLVDAGQMFQLMYESVALFSGDESGGLNGIDQKLQLRQLKIPAPHKPAGGPTLSALNVQSESAQSIKVIVDTFPFRVDPMLCQLGDQLGNGQGVVLIGPFQQDLVKIQQFQLLIFTPGYGDHLQCATESA